LAVDALEEAGRFDRQREAFDSNELRPFAIGLDDLETLLRVRSGAMPLVVHVDRAADIRNVVDAFTAFPDLKLILAGAAEAWKVTERLLAHDIPVLINGLDNLPQNFDRLGARLDQAYLLSAAGVRFALMSGSPYSEFRSLTQAAGVAVANGLAWKQALLAITAVPAEIWGLEGLGKIDRGAKADLVVWSGDPLEVRSAPIAVMVDGEWVNLETRQDRLAKRYLEVLNLETKD
jgi:imidazolonepropionase-like amidohydrolase